MIIRSQVDCLKTYQILGQRRNVLSIRFSPTIVIPRYRGNLGLLSVPILENLLRSRLPKIVLTAHLKVGSPWLVPKKFGSKSIAYLYLMPKASHKIHTQTFCTLRPQRLLYLYANYFLPSSAEKRVRPISIFPRAYPV